MALRGEVQDIGEAMRLALALVVSGDADLLEIVGLSMRVSLTATALACLIGLPLGAFLAIARFPRPGRGAGAGQCADGPAARSSWACWSTCCSRAPARWAFFGLLFTPTAMVIAQTILIAPIVAALSRQVLRTCTRSTASSCARSARPGRDVPDAALGRPLRAADRGAGRLRPGGGRGRRGDDRRRQHRQLYAGDDHGDRARDLQGRAARWRWRSGWS